MNRILYLILLLLPFSVFAWGGYDYETGNYIEIESNNLERQGEEIEYYDYKDGEYKYADVESINRYAGSVEIEVYEHDTGKYRTFEMDN